MASDHVILRIPGLLAGADLSAFQFNAVKAASTDGEVVVVDAITDFCVGILYNTPTDGQAAEVAAGGVLKGRAGGEIEAGSPIAFNTTGRLVQSTTDQRQLIGYAVDGAVTDAVFPFVWQRSRY